MASFSRLHFTMEWDGSPFCGWQRQSESVEAGHKPSIQAVFEKALSTVLHRRERTVVWGCGRLDTGVHALDFHCHADLPNEWSLEAVERLRYSLNCVLPPQICVITAEVVPETWHAQDSSESKTYLYKIFVRRAKPTIDAGRVTWWPAPLDVSAMEKALPLFQGEHDFHAFAAANYDAKSSVRKIYKTEFRFYNKVIELRFHGNGFLKQQVRNMAGFLINIGEGKRQPIEILHLFGEGKGPVGEREHAGLCAPAEGLYLEKVHYKEPGSYTDNSTTTGQ